MIKNSIKLNTLLNITNSSSSSSSSSSILKYYCSGKIYTKTGDKGTSALFNGERRSKCNPIFNVLGTVDELSSHLGVAKEQLIILQHDISGGICSGGICSGSIGSGGSNQSERSDKISKLINEIESIQCLLLDIGSNVATPASTSSEQHLARAKFSDQHTAQLELWIDEHTSHLQPLKNFILPGGGLSASQLQVCRSVCRRSERELVSMRDQLGEDSVNPSVMHFLNRLSDYLFTIARLSTHIQRVEESVYKRVTSTTSKSTTSKSTNQNDSNSNNNNNNNNNNNSNNNNNNYSNNNNKNNNNNSNNYNNNNTNNDNGKYQRHLEKHSTKEIK